MGIVQRQSTLTTIASYAGSALGYLNKTILFTRLLTLEQVGLANVSVEIALTYAQFAIFGLPYVMLRFFPYFDDRRRKHHGFLAFMVWTTFISFLVATSLFLIFKQQIIGYYQKNSPLLTEYFYSIVILSFGIAFQDLLAYYLRSFYKVFIPALVKEVGMRLMMTIALILYGLKWISFEQFMVLYVGSFVAVAVFLFGYLYYLNMLHLRPRLTFRLKRLWKPMAEQGGYSFLSMTSVRLIISLDTIMISGMVSLADAGIYTTMMYFVTFLMLPIRALQNASSPQVAECWKSGDMAKMEDLYKRVSLLGLVAALWVFFGIWINMHNLLKIMGTQYAAGAIAFLLVGIGRLFDTITGLNGVILVTSRYYRADLVFNLALLVLAWAANYYFIGLLGIKGAAIATMISLFGFNLTRMGYVWYRERIHPFSWNLLWVSLVALGAYGVDCLLPRLGTHLFGDIAFRSSIFTLLFLGAVLWLRLVPEFNKAADTLRVRILWK